MIELGVGMQLLRGIGWVFLLIMGAALAAAFVLPSSRRHKALWVGVVLVVFVGPSLPSIFQGIEYRYRYAKAQALFEEKCKTAGEKIYATAEEVEGIALLNLRSGDLTLNEANPDWQAAGLPDDATGDGYIGTFLQWEQPPGRGSKRGFLGASARDAVAAGFRYVDVRQVDGTYRRYRVNGQHTNVRDFLVSEVVKETTTRYAVNYEDIGEQGERLHWVAGARVTVVDTRTGQLMAELRAFSFEPGLGSRAGFRQPWRFARTCPTLERGSTLYATRYFVDQVVKPKQGI